MDDDDIPLMLFPAAANNDISLNHAKMVIRTCLRTIIYTQDLWFLATNLKFDRGFQALQQMSIDQMKQLFNLENITEHSLTQYFGIYNNILNNFGVYHYIGHITNLTDEERLDKQNLINQQIHQHIQEWNNYIFTALLPLPNGINQPNHLEGRKSKSLKKKKTSAGKRKKTAGKRKQTKNKRY